jgi:broad specificity phosphatase PhoE
MIYFIRHAESQYNLVERHIKERIGPDYFDTEEYLT